MGDAVSRSPPPGTYTEPSSQSEVDLARYGLPTSTDDQDLGKQPARYAYQHYGSSFDSQLLQPSQQPQLDQSSAQSAGMIQGGGRGAFNMSSMGSALPTYGHNYGQQSGARFDPARFDPSNPNLGVTYQLQQAPQFVGAMSPPGNSPFNVQIQQQIQNVYHQNPGSQHAFTTGPPHGQPFYMHQTYLPPGQVPAVSTYGHQMSRYGAQGQNFPAAGYPNHYGQRTAYNGERGLMGRQLGTDLFGASPEYTTSKAGSISAGQSSVPRGPPRKPKQSGHALWVGNLPPGTNVVDLKDHFSRDATKEIESVFLISKSNCAFINYKSESSCAAAMTRFHDSRFQGVRLVCRLRRSSVNAVPGVPTGPAALGSQPQAGRVASPEIELALPQEESGSKVNNEGIDSAQVKDKFFIVKSLTLEDLELSVRNGIWATQSHNEDALNKAYETADNVYLIFSANKSGEYFGYARMTSPINNDPAAAIEFAPKAQTVEDPDLPKAIPTLASEFAPKGRIIDDSARGTIFWEAEPAEVDGIEPVQDAEEIQSVKSEEGDAESKAWGKPFKLEWLSTTRLPFYRTRGLRNPWNSNREVKIARDGTELETSVGRRLLQMFHRVPSPVALPLAPMPMMGMPQMMGGYPPHMRYP